MLSILHFQLSVHYEKKNDLFDAKHKTKHIFYKNLFLRKKSSRTRAALDLARVEKGEVIPDSAAPKSDFPFLSRTTIQTLSKNPGTKL